MPSEQKAFARQAKEDFRTFQFLDKESSLAKSQKFVMLQMACEKICKAYELKNSKDYTWRHDVCEKVFPVLAKQYMTSLDEEMTPHRVKFYQSLKSIARKIDDLSPNVKRNPEALIEENCEYPWELATGNYVAPCDHEFSGLSLLEETKGTTFLKIIDTCISALLK